MHRIVLASLSAALALPVFAQSPVSLYGDATPGAGGIPPRILVTGEARLGSSQFAIEVSDAAAGAQSGLVLSSRATDVPFAGARLLVDPTAPLLPLLGPVPASAAGRATFAVPIPALPELEGFSFFGQGLVLDSAAAGGIAASRGVHVTIRREAAVVGVHEVGIETLPVGAPPSHTPWSSPGLFVGGSIALTRDGRTAVTSRTRFPTSTAFEIFDVSQEPAQNLGAFITPNRILAVTIHPTESIAYVSNSPWPYSSVQLDVYDINPSSPTFRRFLRRIVEPTLLGSNMAVSRDGRRLALSAFGEIRILDIEPGSATRGQQVGRIGGGILASRMAWSTDNRTLFYVLVGNSDVQRVDVATGNALPPIPQPENVFRMLVDPTGRLLVTSYPNRAELTVTDLTAPGLPQRVIRVAEPQSKFVFSADGDSLVVGGGRGYSAIEVASGQAFWTALSPQAAQFGILDLALR